jgi:hypothetical protein
LASCHAQNPPCGSSYGLRQDQFDSIGGFRTARSVRLNDFHDPIKYGGTLPGTGELQFLLNRRSIGWMTVLQLMLKLM